ncbi:MAG TPA: hypothetical protein VHJ78_04135 [Actinomycetota bacterium]|nr:hypothetical protein [Actinomycetota bacterium]
MTAAILLAAVTGGVLGILGARSNRVVTSDEFQLWVLAGVVGGPLAFVEWAALLDVAGVAEARQPAWATGVSLASGLLGAVATPPLDDADRRGAWAASLLVKWLRSPIATTAGVLAVMATLLRGRPVDFRRGMLFVDVAPGGSALALGAVGWCHARCFGEGRCLSDALARHEAVHSRTVAAVGELGFYLTYLTAGVAWARIQGGPWNSLTSRGCGQPFEKTAHTYTGDPTRPQRCARRPWSRPAGG